MAHYIKPENTYWHRDFALSPSSCFTFCKSITLSATYNTVLYYYSSPQIPKFCGSSAAALHKRVSSILSSQSAFTFFGSLVICLGYHQYR